MLSGLLLADLVARNRTPLAGWPPPLCARGRRCCATWPWPTGTGWPRRRPVWDEVQEAERRLGEHGRVLLRPSGTEPLVRVMVEAPTQEAAEAAAERIVSALHTALGGVTSP